MNMPRIDLQALWRKLSPADMAIVRLITREKTWRLRATRPILREYAKSRHAAYVWRMAAFWVSPNSKHHCMPTTCFFWLPKGTCKADIQYLNRLVDVITDTIPQEEWWGVRAWSGLSSDQAELRTECLKGFQHDVAKYLKDSADRKARLQHTKDQGSHSVQRTVPSDRRDAETASPF